MPDIKWIRTKDKHPPEDTYCLVAILHRYGNTRWKWARYAGFYIFNKTYGKNCWIIEEETWATSEPDYWMKFPDPPEMTEQEKRMSEKAFRQNKINEINKLKKEMEVLQCQI